MQLKIHELSKSFHRTPALVNISLEIPRGQLTAIIGRSGCGKSTLLRCIDGLESFDSGHIEFGETRLQPKFDRKGASVLDQTKARSLRRNFGLVFQSFNLFPHFTVLENIAKAPMVVKGMKRREAEETACALLEKVGLLSHRDHYPLQLSGGQQQRAAIARALALAPKVMLYDEPTSSLDPWLVDEVFSVMRQLDAEHMTQIVVTHDMRFVREVAAKVVFMDQGQIIESGTVEQLLASAQDARTVKYLDRFFQ